MPKKIVLSGSIANEAIARRAANLGPGIYCLDDCPMDTIVVAVMPDEKTIVNLGAVDFSAQALQQGSIVNGHICLEDGTEVRLSGRATDFAFYQINYQTAT